MNFCLPIWICPSENKYKKAFLSVFLYNTVPLISVMITFTLGVDVKTKSGELDFSVATTE